MEYTIEQFEIEFENAPLDRKREILEKALEECADGTSLKWKEVLIKHKEELKDLQEEMNLEKNHQCIKDIESGTLELYTCIKSVSNFTEGYNYYVKIDDFEEIKSGWLPLMGDLIEKNKYQDLTDWITNMRPVVWIYYDNGIGTLKTRSVFNFSEFSNHFQKFQNNLE